MSELKVGDEVRTDFSKNYEGQVFVVGMSKNQEYFRNERVQTELGFIGYDGEEWICCTTLNFPRKSLRKITKLERALK